MSPIDYSVNWVPKIWIAEIRKQIDEVINAKGFFFSKSLGGPGPMQVLDVSKLTDDQVMAIWNEWQMEGTK